MSALHYHALATPAVARALNGQAKAALGPYLFHLKKGITAARERAERSAVAWERVEAPITVALEALDALFDLPLPPQWYVVEGLGDRAPDVEQPLLVDRAALVRIEALERAGDAWRLRPAEAIAAQAEVRWDGCPVTLRPDEAGLEVFDAAGRPVAVELVERRADGLRVVAPGDVAALHDAAGAVLARPRPPRDGARLLRGQDGFVVPLPQGDAPLAERPPAGTLRADNGVRFAARTGRADTRGVRVQLVAPPHLDDLVDPRDAFFEEGVREVESVRGRTFARHRVLRRFPDERQLVLDEAPPSGATLRVSVNTVNQDRQRRALFALRDRPQPHHRPLLRLFEHPERCRWPAVAPITVDDWAFLTDDAVSGCAAQRRAVEIALGTPDFALIEGPPGSGKTAVVTELVVQAVRRGQRVLLCSTTHVAVDNVVERLGQLSEPVDVLRLGDADRVDESLRAHQIDAVVDGLAGALPVGGPALARQLAFEAADVVCGTTTGVARYDELIVAAEGRPFDLLVLDEASKTTLQEMLVPALAARRWVIVGDVRQLPPFSDRAMLEASLAELKLDDGATLSPARQRAGLLWHAMRRATAPVLLVEPPAVLDALEADLAARGSDRVVARVDAQAGADPAAQTRRLLSADLVLVPPAALPAWAERLPAHLLLATPEAAAGEVGLAHRRRAAPADPRATEQLRRALEERTWAGEVAWRMAREHELRRAADRQRARYADALDALLPHDEAVRGAVVAQRDIALPSVIEVLQEGAGETKFRRPTHLQSGLPHAVLRDRLVSLTHQHRMVPALSAFPRTTFYAGQALVDGSLLTGRDARDGWPATPDTAHGRFWVPVEGRVDAGRNAAEVRAMRRALERLLGALRDHPPRGRACWSVACLTFYLQQSLALRDMLRSLTGHGRGESRFRHGAVEIVSGTVDRFQGREADVVLLSMRNVGAVGFTDSPNRLNVALTRARRRLLVFGHPATFERCRADELQDLVSGTPRLPRPGTHEEAAR
ncbi:MAG: AAA family ATPase [Myxococcales bacterium]|nr:AAA family ATPase [Myxococcales bacterium]